MPCPFHFRSYSSQQWEPLHFSKHLQNILCCLDIIKACPKDCHLNCFLFLLFYWIIFLFFIHLSTYFFSYLVFLEVELLGSRIWLFLELLMALKLAPREVITINSAISSIQERSLPHNLTNTECYFWVFIIACQISEKCYSADFCNLPPYILVLFQIKFVLIH